MKYRFLILSLVGVSLLAGGARAAEGEEAGHMHGPDGRHIAVAETFGPATGKSVLSHHDLKITDTSQFSPSKEGALVVGADVHSMIYKKGDPQAVVHKEHNAYEPENGVYGSHMMYKEPGEYVIVENVTMPGGKKYTLEFPIWVPAPPAAKEKAASTSPVLLGVIALAALALIGVAFVLGRRSGRRAAATLSLLALTGGLLPLSIVHAEEDEPGHMHGPDGRHIAAPAASGGQPGDPLRAFLGPNREIEAFQTKDQYRFALSIENEELAPPDPNVVSLTPAAGKALDLQVVPVAASRLADGLSTTGQVRPNPNGAVTVNARVGGRVLRMGVTPGQQVNAGQVVAVIDSTEIAEAQAALRAAQAAQRQAEAARGHARAEVRRAQSQVSEAEAALQRVRAQQAEAQAEVDRAKADVGVAASKVASARKHLTRQQQLAASGAFAQGPVEAARSAVAQAEGELQAARQALGNLETQARRLEQGLRDGVVAQKDVEAAQTAAAQGRTRVATGERQLEIARGALAREERIQRENLRDAREVQQAQSELETAELGVRSAEAAVVREQKAAEAAAALVAVQQRMVQTARAQVEATRGELREADAAAGGARQAVRAGLNHLQVLGASPTGGSQLTVLAPIGGEVHQRPVNTGQTVAAGETLAAILNTRSVWVESNVFEKDLPRVRPGQRVAITSDASPGRPFNGSINSIESEVDPQTRAVRVRTVVLNPSGELKPNMYVRVVIDSGQASAVTVPLEALQEHAGEQVVFVEQAPGLYERRVVTVGPALGSQVVVETGLKGGERVVTRGAYQLLAKLGK